jgi:hypothetical protein
MVQMRNKRAASSRLWMVATGLLESTSKHHRKLPEQRRDRPDIPRLPENRALR